MKKTRNVSDLAAVSLLLAVGAVFIALILYLGGCAFEEEENGEPLPQQESSIDYEPPETGEASSGLTVEDFGPESGIGSSAEALTTGEEGAPRAAFRYDRRRALEYVERYARSPNRRYAYCGDWTIDARGKPYKVPADCTSFASQVLAYAGFPQERTGRNDTGWWYKWGCAEGGSSASWRSVNRLVQYLVNESRRAEFRSSARELQVGDLIFYRLRREDDGYSCDGNLFNHATVVSGFDANGEPLVSYHSNEALHVPWNARNGSLKALGEACLTGFVHIRD